MFDRLIEDAGRLLDTAGVLTTVLGALLAALVLRRTPRRPAAGDHGATGVADSYQRYRQQLGRAILLGLEFLVAADIIRTVAVTPTLRSVAVLGGIVLIRTFLSFSLELEITGRWPWQHEPTGSPGAGR